MAGLYWMMLTFFLAAPNSSAALDPAWLAHIVEGIRNEYSSSDSFSLAANIPQNQDPNSLEQVLQQDSADKVEEAVSKGQVYQGTRVVAAAQSGAMPLVLRHIQPFIKSSQGNVLVVYSGDAPAAETNGIGDVIREVTQNWQGYAFVFSKEAQSPKQLEIPNLGLGNIFHCYEPEGDSFQCTSCSSGGDVAASCVANTQRLSQDQGAAGVEALGDVANIISSLGDVRGHEDMEEGGKMSKCKGSGGKGCKAKGGRRGRKGGKVRKGRKRGKGGKVRKGGKRGKGGKVRKGRKRGKGGKVRKGRKRGKGRKGKRGGKSKRRGKRRSKRRG
ncbi:uncharacterized protein LOC125003572 [Mugil cephalus]|uniref:uncharacterized protein LOC125003572 n=1 Tax=Mugil cephalus TaxID=48193 RepID=UPI001FB6ABF0|nr:uncharacterized protein LOC125003572 [Mugil cephalus]